MFTPLYYWFKVYYLSLAKLLSNSINLYILEGKLFAWLISKIDFFMKISLINTSLKP